MRNLDWLLSGEEWIQYRTRIDLLHEELDEETDCAYRGKIISDPRFSNILSELEQWPGKVMKNHKDSSHPIHKLAFLADVGITVADVRMANVVEKVRRHQSEEGVFQVLTNIPTHFGGTGEDTYAWLLCDAPTILHALAKMGLHEDEEIIHATRYLAGLQEENGWRCKGAKELGKFRGPGRKADPCPYANLLMLKLTAEMDRKEFRDVGEKGIEALLGLWEHRSERKEYMFGMGTDFTKLKAPLVWLDILHVLDVLSQYKEVHNDLRFREMVHILRDKLNEDGRLTAESMYRPWKEWEFADKKTPSRWITFLVYRIFDRIGMEA